MPTAIADFIVTRDKTLRPRTKEAEALMDKLEPGHIVEMTLLWPRSTAFNNLVFGTIDRVAKHRGMTPDDLRAELMLSTGRFRVLKLDKKNVIILNSMHRSAMPEREMHRFWEEVQPLLEGMLEGSTTPIHEATK